MTSDVVLNVGIAFVFIFAASWLASRLNYSSIPFLILLGMIFGPNGPEFNDITLRIVSNNQSIELLSRLGVLLLLFYLGLEFSAGKLASAGKNLFKGGVTYVLLNFVRGLIFGWIFFGSWTEIMVVAGITVISSSAIITKMLVDLKRTANPETELVLGIMVFEDVFIALFLSVLSGMLIINGVSHWQVALNMVVIFVFVLSTITFGRRISSFLEERLKFKTIETFTLAIFTLLLLAGIMSEKIHIAEAIGALLLGLVLAETTHNNRIVQMITPMRDLFGAMFFFSFGMTINYRVFNEVVFIAAAAVLMTVIGNILIGLLAAWLTGYKKRRAANVAFTVIARGEFSIIVASMAVAAGLNEKLPAFAALYVLVLAFISPALAKNSRYFYELYERARCSLGRGSAQT